MRIGLSLLASLLSVQFAWGGMLMYRPGQEYRTINAAAYELIIQKAGRVDVHMMSEEPVFTSAFPMVWLDGDDTPRLLPVDGRMSAREAVNDPLGEGQGMVLRKKTCTWTLRAYPAEPYFAVQVAYMNTGKKPIKIRALYPWCVGEPAKGGVFLGLASPQSVAFVENEQGQWAAATENQDTPRALCLANEKTRRMVLAGFMERDTARQSLHVEKIGKAEDAAFGEFRAACMYDPPIELAPGEQLVSGVLYLSVAEQSPTEGLERLHRVQATVSKGNP